MLMTRLSLMACMVFAALPSPAMACLISDSIEAVIHDELPTPLPPDTFVAEVSIEGQPDDLFGAGLKARVLRRIQGEDSGSHIVLKKSFWSSCSQPFDNGMRGLIVAVPRGREAGLMVVDPIEVSRSDKHRLPDGYTVSPVLRSGILDTEQMEEELKRNNPPAPADLIPRALFTPGERAALSERARQDCLYSAPKELKRLNGVERDKALTCFVRSTVKHGGTLLPKEIGPGATITSASEFQGMLIFIVLLEANHPRAIAPEEESTDFDKLLSNRTCQDNWLNGLIDAGMDNGQQARTAIVYQYQDKKQATLAATAVVQCSDGNEKAGGD